MSFDCIKICSISYAPTALWKQTHGHNIQFVCFYKAAAQPLYKGVISRLPKKKKKKKKNEKNNRFQLKKPNSFDFF